MGYKLVLLISVNEIEIINMILYFFKNLYFIELKLVFELLNFNYIFFF